MANYRNQKVVRITNVSAIYNNDESNAKGELFLHSVQWRFIQAAKKILTESGFTVWLYFLKWSGMSEPKDFSPAQVKEEFGLSENGARNGFDDLLKNGYLSKFEGRKNLYVFTPISTTQVTS